MTKKKKSRAGRKPMGETKLTPFTIRVDRSQQREWQKAAKASNLSLSEWIRLTLDKAAWTEA